MTKIGVPVPKTVILPSNELPDRYYSMNHSQSCLSAGLGSIFNYVGFPAYMKPFAGGGWKNVYKLSSADEFFAKTQRNRTTGNVAAGRNCI